MKIKIKNAAQHLQLSTAALLSATLSFNASADVPSKTDRLRQLIESKFQPKIQRAYSQNISSSHDAHHGSSLPENTEIISVTTEGERAYVCLKVDASFLQEHFDDIALEHLGHQVEDWLEQLGETNQFHLQITPTDATECRDAPYYLNTIQQEPAEKIEPKGKPIEAQPWLKKSDDDIQSQTEFEKAWLASVLSPQPATNQPNGALSGASIFLSPGHGWYYNSSLGRFATQRGNTHNIIEDLSNAEAVLQYLVPYLWNAGARVYTTRERDLNSHSVVIDDNDSNVSYTGSGWSTHNNDLNWQDSHREIASTSGSATATATYTPTIPEAGHYAVYVWYGRASDGNTSSQAKFVVNHSGGSTEWVQDQSKDGNTWSYIGTYYFEQGSNSTKGSLEINNSGIAGETLVVDAVRFGGGMGDMIDPDSGTTSGKPRWEESGKYHAGYLGKSNWETANTVNAMPRWAAWENESWEQGKSVYVSWHTNAPEGGLGTSSYAYSSSGFNGPFNGVEGGLELRDIIYNELINDIRAGYDSNWTSRGQFTNWFGEVNPSHNPEMPAALFEIAFHATQSDASALKDPKFRKLAARAMYQGLVKFYSQHMDGFNNNTLTPESPTHLNITQQSGEVTIRWQAPDSNNGNGLLGDPATQYKVYVSQNGKGFDNGTVVNGTSITGSSLGFNSLENGATRYIRVTALNNGGESFPTETLSFRKHSANSKALIVNGFDRISASQNIVENDPHDSAALHRGYLNRMNTFDYSIAHSEALEASNIYFDSTSNEAVISGSVNLSQYEAVFWILGEESTADETFNTTEQNRVINYLEDGGALFVSGSEIGWDLGRFSGEDKDFYNQYLHTDYISDDANSYQATGIEGSIFEGIDLSFDNGSSIYDANYPDVITGYGNANIIMNYSGTGQGGAAIAHQDSETGHRVIMLGFPFETILEKEQRNAVMATTIDYFCEGTTTLCGHTQDESDLQVSLVGKDGKAKESGDQYLIRYDLNVNNLGYSTARNITIVHSAPNNSEFVLVNSQNASCHSDNTTLSCDLDSLASNQAETINLQIRRPVKDKANFTAQAAHSGFDPNINNNSTEKTFGGSSSILFLLSLLGLGIYRHTKKPRTEFSVVA